MSKEKKTEWEAALKELTRLAEKFPSRELYQQMAECYRRIDEHYEASIMQDMAKSLTVNAPGSPKFN